MMKLFLFDWQHIYDFRLVHLTDKFKHDNSRVKITTCCIIIGLFISLKIHYEKVSEKEPIFADEGATHRALLKNKNTEK
jgi:hypothetical protein